MRTQLIRLSLSHLGKLAVIAVLFLGGTYAFDTLRNLHIINSSSSVVEASGNVDIWWPTNNVVVNGLQPFKALLKDKNLSDYDMFWSVDGGQPVRMDDSQADYPHKEAAVDLSGWNWRGAGPYTITFKALDKSGNTINETSVSIMTSASAQEVKSSQASASPASSLTTQQASAQTIEQAVVVSDPVVTAVQAETQSSKSNKKDQDQPQAKPETQATAVSAPAVSAPVAAWWPTNNAVITGTQPFKAVLDGRSTDTYKMYWSVDGGAKNEMYNSSADAPHKEAMVDVSSWSWKGTGPYKIAFIAENNDGSKIGEKAITIYTGTPAAAPTTSAPQQIASVSAPIKTMPGVIEVPAETTSSGNPLSGAKLYVNPNSNAKNTAHQWRTSRPADAAVMDKIAAQAEVKWLGGWNTNISSDVKNAVSAAKNQGAVPVFVAYNIPHRDCGQHSAGGVNDANAYRGWIQQIADAIGSDKAAVILEPDALTLTSCLSDPQKQERNTMLKTAISQLKAKGAIAVYLDVGHAGWLSADDAASKLNNAGIAQADGFALNTSNFVTTADNTRYGEAVSSKTGGKHFIIDTARNGSGPTSDYQWCNPWGRALGNKPTTSTGHNLIDAYLWVKTPGESDGNCNGGPSAGTWWPDYALGLAKNAGW